MKVSREKIAVALGLMKDATEEEIYTRIGELKAEKREDGVTYSIHPDTWHKSYKGSPNPNLIEY